MMFLFQQCRYTDAGIQFVRHVAAESVFRPRVINITLFMVCLLSFHMSVAQAQDSWISVGASPDIHAQLVAAVDSTTCFLLYDIGVHKIPGHPGYVTRDGGLSWEKFADSLVSIDCQDFNLLTRLDAARIGDATWLRLLQSADTGRTWTEMRTLPSSTLVGGDSIQRLTVLSSDADRACIFVGSRIYKIARDGEAPEVYQLPMKAERCFRAGKAFITWGRENPWVAQKIIVSTDFGLSWESVLENPSIYDVRPGKGASLWAAMCVLQYGTDIQVVRSDDRGRSWRNVPVPRKGYFHAPVKTYIYPPIADGQFLWIRTEHEWYARNSDNTWDALANFPQEVHQPPTYQWISRCSDGSSWTTALYLKDIYRSIKTPQRAQSLNVKDLSSYGQKRANVIIPHIGWEAWQEAIVERMDEQGPFVEIGRVYPPDFFFTDESINEAGPFRYRVTFPDLSGKYHQLESSPVFLNRDSVLILDLLEYLLIPPGIKLEYDNGWIINCALDSTTRTYRYTQFKLGKMLDAGWLRISRHPDLLLEEDGVTVFGMLNQGSDHSASVGKWRQDQRFIVTEQSAESIPGTITISAFVEAHAARGLEQLTLVRHVGIIKFHVDWRSISGQSSETHIELARVLDATPVTELPMYVALKTPYPNPVRTVLHIPVQLSEPCVLELTINDLLGRTLSTIAYGAYPAGIREYLYDTSRLLPGTYFLCLRCGSRVDYQMFIR
jgi:hypothetical protein